MTTVTQVVLDLDPDQRDYTDAEARALEMEYLGFYINDPLYDFEDVIRGNSVTTTEEVKRHMDGDWIRAVGIVEDPRVFNYTPKRTRIPEQGCRWVLKTLDDKIPCVVFGVQYQRAWSLLEEGSVILVSGKHNEYNGDVGLIVNAVKPGSAINRLAEEQET